MKVRDLSSQAVTAIIPLYKITPVVPTFLENESFYFTAYRTRDDEGNAIDIEFDGNTYTPVPIKEVDRQEQTLNLEIYAPDDFISMCLDTYNNFLGAEVTIVYVLKKYIDESDNTAGLGRETYIITQLEHSNRQLVSWICSKNLFVRRSNNFPIIEVNKTYCPYKYRYWETAGKVLSNLSYVADGDVLTFSGDEGSFSFGEVFELNAELSIQFSSNTDPYGPYEIAEISASENEIDLTVPAADSTAMGATSTVQEVPMDVEFLVTKFFYPPGKEVCPYVGDTYYDIDGNEVKNAEDDVASKHESTCCAVRFPDDVRPFGGFLGVRDIR